MKSIIIRCLFYGLHYSSCGYCWWIHIFQFWTLCPYNPSFITFPLLYFLCFYDYWKVPVFDTCRFCAIHVYYIIQEKIHIFVMWLILCTSKTKKKNQEKNDHWNSGNISCISERNNLVCKVITFKILWWIQISI